MNAAALSILLLAAPSHGVHIDFWSGEDAYLGFDLGEEAQPQGWMDFYLTSGEQDGWWAPPDFVYRASPARDSRFRMRWTGSFIEEFEASTPTPWHDGIVQFNEANVYAVGAQIEMQQPFYGLLYLGSFPAYSIVELVPGDVDLDGIFNSADLVLLFERGHFEDAVSENSSWTSGDFNDDLEFSTRDLVIAFEAGGYSAAAAAVPEPSAIALLMIGLACFACRSMKRIGN